MKATNSRPVAGSPVVLRLPATGRTNDDLRRRQSVITGQA